MKKWKDLPRNEKWMLVIIVLLLIGIATRWAVVKEGVGRGFEWFNRDRQTETEK
jgi:hypothetical protein